MVMEVVHLPIKAGQESAFEAAMTQGRQQLLAGQGCRSVKLSRGVENRSKYLLQIEWDSVDAHTAFTQTEAFAAFRALAAPFYAERPAMEHFEAVQS